MAKKTTAEPINVDYDILINEEFEVDFDSNPTTGYSWRWANSQAVEIVDSVGHSYVATPSQMKLSMV